MTPDARLAFRRAVGRAYDAGLASRARVRLAGHRLRSLPAHVKTWRRGPTVRDVANEFATAVDQYWARHLVRTEMFASAAESDEYLEWRFAEYPAYRELMELWGIHDDEVILDYGCGPANDTVGFLLYTKARRVIGVDVSARALELARKRIALHRVEEARVELIRVSDAHPEIPLKDGSVDLHCSGFSTTSATP